MHANPQQLQDQERRATSQLHAVPRRNTLGPFMLRFLRLLRLAFWRAFQHDAFAIAKASAYSAILTFFPALLVIGAVLATSRETDEYLREISYALGRILPAGSATALAYLRGTTQRSVGVLISASLITLWTASGVMVSWMEGFRRCYELPKSWGLVKERLIAFSLVILAGIPLTFLDRAGRFWQSHRDPDSVSTGPRVWPFHFVDVDGHPVVDRRSYQHRRDLSDLSQCGAAYPTLA